MTSAAPNHSRFLLKHEASEIIEWIVVVIRPTPDINI
jgi:hypothetical protein